MTAKAYDNIIQTVHDTPLVKINRLLPSDAATLYVKCEFFNPMASVKDRIGAAMIEAAEQNKTINKDTHIIEPTSGNTGIALAFVCAAKGYKITLTMPESMSVERRALLKALGASLVLTPAAGGMKAAIEKAAELVSAQTNAWMPQQFENPANPAIHYATTGPEIWQATQGKVDILVAGVGTGGTISGAGQFLKSKNQNIQCIAVEPTESPVITQTRQQQELKPGPHKIQGIGAGFIPRNLDLSIIDGVQCVSNDEAFQTARILSKQEGVFGGISTGAAIAAAMREALKPENKGKTIVAIGPSFAERYISTPLFEQDSD